MNQRMGKRQPMCWTAEGAHLLLQIRCAVLDGRLDAIFRERYPKLSIAGARIFWFVTAIVGNDKA